MIRASSALAAKFRGLIRMKDPNRFVEEPCEFCGFKPTVRWYDCCCDAQHKKYIKECSEYVKEEVYMYDI